MTDIKRKSFRNANRFPLGMREARPGDGVGSEYIVIYDRRDYHKIVATVHRDHIYDKDGNYFQF